MTDTPESAFQLASMAPRKRRTGLVVGLAAVAAALIAVGAGTAYALAGRAATTAARAASTPSSSPSPDGPRTYLVNGTVILKNGHTARGSACEGDANHLELHAGALVMLLDSVGNATAMAKLGPGTVNGTNCVFQFALRDVPSGRGTYQLAIGIARGPVVDEATLASGTPLVFESA